MVVLRCSVMFFETSAIIGSKAFYDMMIIMKLRESHDKNYDDTYFDIFFRSIFNAPKTESFGDIWDERYFTRFRVESTPFFKKFNELKCWYNKVTAKTVITNTPYYIENHPYGYLPHTHINRHWDDRNEWIIESRDDGWVYLEIIVVDSQTSAEDGDEIYKNKKGFIIHANLFLTNFDWGGEDLKNPVLHIETSKKLLNSLFFFNAVKCDENSVCFSGKVFFNDDDLNYDATKVRLHQLFCKIKDDVLSTTLKPLIDYLMWQYENI